MRERERRRENSCICQVHDQNYFLKGVFFLACVTSCSVQEHRNIHDFQKCPLSPQIDLRKLLLPHLANPPPFSCAGALSDLSQILQKQKRITLRSTKKRQSQFEIMRCAFNHWILLKVNLFKLTTMTINMTVVLQCF